VYVGTYTSGDSRGIYRFQFDEATGDASDPVPVAELANPSFLGWHPDRPLLYAVSETSDGPDRAGLVVAFAVDEDGGLTRINEQPSGGAGPCYVSVHPDGTHVFVANYGGGSVAAFPVRSDGGLDDATAVVQHAGSSVNERRQQAPHAHAILAAPGGSFVFAADLGIDRVQAYHFARDGGTLTPHEPGTITTAPGAGPRHLAFHPDGEALYVINELDSTVGAYTFDATHGTVAPRGVVSTLPAGFEGTSYPSEVAVHPTGRFVYGANRGHNSIAAFRVGDDHGLTFVGAYETDGDWPRHFAVHPSGTFLFAANQRSDSITVFVIDQQTGALSDTGTRIAVPSPAVIRFR
jgi:6-phosphogluconolactonase